MSYVRYQNRYMAMVLLGAAILVIMTIVAIIGFVGRQGLLTLSDVSWREFFLSPHWNPTSGQYGALVFILGSLAVTFLALLFGAPLGLAAAIYMAKIAGGPMRDVMRAATDLFVGIPSVVYGWIGLTVLIPVLQRLTGQSGFGLLPAAIVLGIMILPTLVSISEDALRALPISLEEASLALGATRWQTIWEVLLPAARPGILTAMVLAMARAIGETMAVQMLIGNTPQLPRGLIAPTSALTSEIVVEMANTPFGSTWNNALFLMALVLLLISLALILLIRFISRGRLT
ncbi:MAG: phosphate ABC transporter permease subunit PstC [Firmicutes bacterium]|nr:phosphate ABC transporter permease subunit PstC [Bacillota bacterium]MCL5039382.1 phosphate ABC transporter permease subunit PstC [Bacillota bacterium]